MKLPFYYDTVTADISGVTMETQETPCLITTGTSSRPTTQITTDGEATAPAPTTGRGGSMLVTIATSMVTMSTVGGAVVTPRPPCGTTSMGTTTGICGRR